MCNYLSTTISNNQDDFLSIENGIELTPKAMLENLDNRLSKKNRDTFYKNLRKLGFSSEVPLEMIINDRERRE